MLQALPSLEQLIYSRGGRFCSWALYRLPNLIAVAGLFSEAGKRRKFHLLFVWQVQLEWSKESHQLDRTHFLKKRKEKSRNWRGGLAFHVSFSNLKRSIQMFAGSAATKHWLTQDCSGGFINPLYRNKEFTSKLYLRFIEIIFVLKCHGCSFFGSV